MSVKDTASEILYGAIILSGAMSLRRRPVSQAPENQKVGIASISLVKATSEETSFSEALFAVLSKTSATAPLIKLIRRPRAIPIAIKQKPSVLRRRANHLAAFAV